MHTPKAKLTLSSNTPRELEGITGQGTADRLYLRNAHYNPNVAYNKHAQVEGVYTPMQTASVQPADEAFTGDVYILLSEYTISTAEPFLRVMLANPDHKI